MIRTKYVVAVIVVRYIYRLITLQWSNRYYTSIKMGAGGLLGGLPYIQIVSAPESSLKEFRVL